MVFFMSILVFLYVWQNIEVIRIEMDYRKLAKIEKRLLKENDLLKSRIESYRKIDVVEKKAAGSGYRKIRPGDLEIVDTRKTKR